MNIQNVSLDDKYLQTSGKVYLTGIQALVRLPLMQKARDEARGLNTGGFISGYRGSPIGGYDRELLRVKDLLERRNIRFQPGLNEDLAATAVWGSQQVGLFEGAQVHGVFGIWYGKGPGADRSGDVFKHANGAGSSKHGGVLAIVGDDHGCHSSTMPHQSEHDFIAAQIPVIAPASLQDYIDFGLLGFEMSRYSGCWVAVKAVAQTIETGGTVDIDPEEPKVVAPADFELPQEGLNIRLVDPPLEQEKRLHGPRMRAIAAFAKANSFDRLVWQSKSASIGIAASGKAYLDVVEALKDLGIDEAKAGKLGIRLYKVGLVWPLEQTRLKEFAAGLDEIIVVEEKRGLIEDQIAKVLINEDVRPRIVGKQDEQGEVLFQSTGELDPLQIAAGIGQRLLSLPGAGSSLAETVAALGQMLKKQGALQPLQIRQPFFCSGCPHNTSTLLPEGSRGMAGIGCHGMVAFMPERRTHLWSHMGGEGLAWVGQAPFTSQKHVFQNLGDGTYSHSGLLAIRAAAAAGVNITYKILYNDAVAMTGGQDVEGDLTVEQICRQVAAEGARRIVVVTDEPEKYSGADKLPGGIDIRHRDELDAVQRELREEKGLTILVYDQTCAAEKRRRRKRGKFPDPDRRIFINTAVCENCGDCSAKSNCISVQPVDTDLGRKRRIDQSSCNKDFSCVRGFCPSFVSVSGATPRKDTGAMPLVDEPDLPLPDFANNSGESIYSILVTGIGGTGVITVGALLGMAARLDGKHCTVLDSTGMAQKNGAVMSHVRISDHPVEVSSRITSGKADLLLAYDLVVATTPGAISAVRKGRTRAIASSDVTPTATFVRNRDFDPDAKAMFERLNGAAGKDAVDAVPAQSIARQLMGDAIGANTFMLGYAFQKGALPISLDALLRAMELNAVAVEFNKTAFTLGRKAALDPEFFQGRETAPAAKYPQTRDEIVEHRSALLTAYQNRAYAKRYRDAVEQTRQAESRLGFKDGELSGAVAVYLAKLMAYKDEYEVARLYTDGAFRKQLQKEFDGSLKVKLHLAPPILAKRDPVTGEPRKRTFGPWMFSALRLLAPFKFLRGTRFDPFGMTQERRSERRLIDEYFETLQKVLGSLNASNFATAVELLSLPDQIRGFGHVKLQSMEEAAKRREKLLGEFHSPAKPKVAA